MYLFSGLLLVRCSLVLGFLLVLLHLFGFGGGVGCCSTVLLLSDGGGSSSGNSFFLFLLFG